MADEVASAALLSAFEGEEAYCKFLSANDTGLTNAHQSGYLIGINSWQLLFPELKFRTSDAERTVRINWNQGDVVTESRFKFYPSKNELRLTRFGKGFPFLRSEYCGALFVLVRCDRENYDAFVLNTDEDIDTFLNAFGIEPTETNRLLPKMNLQEAHSADSPRHAKLISAHATELLKREMMRNFVAALTDDFPDSKTMSLAAQKIDAALSVGKDAGFCNPDRKIISLEETEYALFREVEAVRYADILEIGFESLDDFIKVANQVLNRRKSRAGKGIEHHLEAIFDYYKLTYTAQGITEGKKKPDFVFPSIEAYHDLSFPTASLTSLAAKRTCKDRWRQIITEADRLQNSTKYLFTLQAGNSPAQLEEMRKSGVVLVVPKSIIGAYPTEYRHKILSLAQFIALVKEREK